MLAKSNVRRSVCTRPAAQRSSRSANHQRFKVRRTRSERVELQFIGRSSNGRTTASDAVYLGSNPSLPAKRKKPLFIKGFFLPEIWRLVNLVGQHHALSPSPDTSPVRDLALPPDCP